MTKLTTPVRRETKAKYGKRNIVVVLAPAGSTTDAFIAFRLTGTRTQYLTSVSSLYRLAALWHGQKESTARRIARKNGIPWRYAKKQFYRDNSIPETGKQTKRKDRTNEQ